MILNLRTALRWLIFAGAIPLFLLNNTSGFAGDKNISPALSHYIMALYYKNTGELDKAVYEFSKAAKYDPKNSTIHFSLAVAYIKDQKLEKAVDELNLAIKLSPEAVEPHAVLALVYYSMNKSKEANREYEFALQNASKIQPGNIYIYKNLGIVYLQNKKFKDAENIYRLILKISPNDAEAHFYLANIYEELKNRRMVESELREAIKLKPDYHEALNYLGYLEVEENKNLAEAEKMITKALSLDSENGAYLDSMGWLYFKKGRFDKAVEYLERAGTLMEDAVIYDHLGDAYYKVSDKEKARLNWTKSLKLDPNQAKVKDKLKMVK